MDRGGLHWRYAGPADVAVLAQLNRQLQEEEGSKVMSGSELRDRLSRWLDSGYRAVTFEDDTQLVAYALFRDTDPDSEGSNGIYLRQFFVIRERRREGIGRRAFEILDTQVWPHDRRIVLEALSSNPAGQGFWRALGFREYCIRYEHARERTV